MSDSAFSLGCATASSIGTYVPGLLSAQHIRAGRIPPLPFSFASCSIHLDILFNDDDNSAYTLRGLLAPILDIVKLRDPTRSPFQTVSHSKLHTSKLRLSTFVGAIPFTA